MLMALWWMVGSQSKRFAFICFYDYLLQSFLKIIPNILLLFLLTFLVVLLFFIIIIIKFQMQVRIHLVVFFASLIGEQGPPNYLFYFKHEKLQINHLLLQLELYSLPLKVPLLHLETKGIEFIFQFENFPKGHGGRLQVVFGLICGMRLEYV